MQEKRGAENGKERKQTEIEKVGEKEAKDKKMLCKLRLIQQLQ